MKGDIILSSIINFLVPIISLYGLFFLIDFFETGFFAFIYAAILFISAFMIYLVKFGDGKKSKGFIFNLEFIAFFLVLLLISYLIAILFSITGFISF